MNRDEARDLCAYDDWANARTLAAVRALPPAELTKNTGSSFPTLRGTVAHLVGAEWVWLERWLGRSPREAPPWLREGPLSELEEVLHRVEEERRVRVEALSDEALESWFAFAYLDGRSGSLKLSDLLRHVVNHSTYHRGQLVTMVRQAGGDVQPTDYVAWLDPARR